MYRKRYFIVKPVASALLETLMQDETAGEIYMDGTAQACALKGRRKRLRERGMASAPENPGKGSILAALRRSPLVGTDLDVGREPTRGRKICGPVLQVRSAS
jgi:hypothetical protein